MNRLPILTLAAMLWVLPCAAAAQEADHLTCIKVKDTNKVKVDQNVDLTGGIGIVSLDVNCTVKGKAKFLCTPSVKDNADDPLGPEVRRDYVCYKVKCAGSVLPNFGSQTQFGINAWDKPKVQMVCAPGIGF